MKISTLIPFLLLFGLFHSCNEKPENKNVKFIESKLFGKIKSIETQTFENDTLKSRVLEFYKKNGQIEKKETYFEPNLSSIIRHCNYDNKNRLISEQIITDGDSTFSSKYLYNNLGLEKKEDYYEKKLHSITTFRLNSLGKITEKNFKYVNSNGLRTFKIYYPDSLTTITKEFLKGNPNKITELKIDSKENKKITTTNRPFLSTQKKEIFYHNNDGNLEKKEIYSNGEIIETIDFSYELDKNKNWVKSINGIKRKERTIEYYNQN